MGATFKYIADSALEALCLDRGVCHHCDRDDTPIFRYNGTIIDPSLASDTDLALEHPGVDELCAACINSGNVRKQGTKLREIASVIAHFASDEDAATDAYHSFPDLPFFQGNTWAMCCGDFAEFIGEYPPDGTRFPEYEQWNPQDELMATFKLEDFYPLKELPVMHIMALFHCPQCPRKYWAFQYSGLGWPGPLAHK